ncbi:UNVERIFIED_CONTAM: gdf-8 [Trichonephila clavipes]
MRQHTFLQPTASSSSTFRLISSCACKRRSGAMRSALSALVIFLVVSLSGASLEPEAQQVLRSLKKRILAELGMKHFPDMRLVNTTQAQMHRMTRKYLRNVKRSEQELLTFHHTACEKNSHVVFHPEIDYDSHLQWARLKFPNDSSLDISEPVFRWREDGQEPLLSLHCIRCCGAKLELKTRTPSILRLKRSACGGKCCRRPLSISFADIGWNWIVQPKEFEAFYCKGRCNDSKGHFANTHALMQSILKIKGHNVSRPCCAPKKLRPLELLHYDDKNPPELTVTKMKGMIVKECACT